MSKAGEARRRLARAGAAAGRHQTRPNSIMKLSIRLRKSRAGGRGLAPALAGARPGSLISRHSASAGPFVEAVGHAAGAVPGAAVSSVLSGQFVWRCCRAAGESADRPRPPTRSRRSLAGRVSCETNERVGASRPYLPIYVLGYRTGCNWL